MYSYKQLWDYVKIKLDLRLNTLQNTIILLEHDGLDSDKLKKASEELCDIYNCMIDLETEFGNDE